MSVIRWRISLADRVKAAQRVGGRTFCASVPESRKHRPRENLFSVSRIQRR